MLHPDQFRVNEAWIVFRLNDAPIRTEVDGDFNCFALMDAASCFILTTVFVPAKDNQISKLQARRLLKKGSEHKHALPETLFIPSGKPADNLTHEARRQDVTVVRIPEDQLMVFIGEAREGFKEHLGGESMQ